MKRMGESTASFLTILNIYCSHNGRKGEVPLVTVPHVTIYEDEERMTRGLSSGDFD